MIKIGVSQTMRSPSASTVSGSSHSSSRSPTRTRRPTSLSAAPNQALPPSLVKYIFTSVVVCYIQFSFQMLSPHIPIIPPCLAYVASMCVDSCILGFVVHCVCVSFSCSMFHHVDPSHVTIRSLFRVVSLASMMVMVVAILLILWQHNYIVMSCDGYVHVLILHKRLNKRLQQQIKLWQNNPNIRSVKLGVLQLGTCTCTCLAMYCTSCIGYGVCCMTYDI